MFKFDLIIRFFLWMGICIFILLPFVITSLFGPVGFEQVVFHLLCVNPIDYALLFMDTLIFYGSILIILCVVLMRLKIKIHWMTTLFIMAVIFCGFKTGLFDYYKTILWSSDSDLYEKYYVHPFKQQYEFPDDPKNVIIIVMESMEKTFQNVDGKNLIPFISHLQNKHTTFYGFEQVYGTNYTMAGLVSLFGGIPLRMIMPDEKGRLLPKAPSIIDILKQKNYHTMYMNGGSVSFMNKKAYLKTHGFDAVLGKEELTKWADSNHYAFEDDLNEFGLNDSDLYKIALIKIDELSQKPAPFFVTLLTVGTHNPHGYLSKSCPNHNQRITDSIVCADLLLKKFITALQNKPYYPHTVIILVGDHLQMKTPIMNDLNKKRREIITTILHANDTPKRIHKSYTHFDLAPTILQMLGVHFESNRFGLGTSLLSNKKTLIEELGYGQLNQELKKPSKQYNSFIH